MIKVSETFILLHAPLLTSLSRSYKTRPLGFTGLNRVLPRAHDSPYSWI